MILVAGCSMLDARCRMLDAGCSMLGARYWMLDAGCSMLDARCWMLDSLNALSIVDFFRICSHYFHATQQETILIQGFDQWVDNTDADCAGVGFQN
jgi:hypothetical protein